MQSGISPPSVSNAATIILTNSTPPVNPILSVIFLLASATPSLTSP
jgi:hypothetical protein